MDKISAEAKLSGMFRRFAQAAAVVMGRPWAFAVAAGAVVVWAALGPIFKFSDTWQLAINTSTTIVTFLMVFLIQNTQKRDSEALQLKLDELILATHKASNEFVEIEDLDDKMREAIKKDMHQHLKDRR